MLNSKVTNINNIRKNIIPYMISFISFYILMIIFFTWWVADFNNSFIFSPKETFIMYFLFLLLLSFIIFFVHPKNFKKYFKIGSIGSILLIIFYHIVIMLKLSNHIQNIIYLLPIFMSTLYISLLQIYIYIMNNTEKFYSMIIANFIQISLVILQDIGFTYILNNFLTLVILFIISIIPSFKFKSEDYINEEKIHKEDAPKINKVFYLSLIINCIFLIFCRGTGRSFLLIANDMYSFNLEIYYYLGGAVGCILMYLLYTFVKKCNSITWNLIFCLFILSSFLFILPSTELIKNIYSFIIGISVMMGMNGMYYTLGVISKKYWNFTYTRHNILIIALIGCGISTPLGNYLYYYNNEKINTILLMMSVIVILTLLLFSPILTSTFFKDKWTEDSKKAIIDNKDIRKYTKYNLTNKEMEVCNYILENLTVRQIAINMNISENTVKFHKKQIFKKLNINSKEELGNIMKES